MNSPLRPFDPVRARDRMVRNQLAARGIRDARVLEAMRSVPRERFVPPESAADAYADAAQSIGEGQTISQPFVVARMVEALELAPHERVLEVGVGSGYAAAVMARLAREVIGVERIPALAARAARTLRELGVENVRVVTGDGALGLPEEAPFDAISVAAASPRVPPALLEQLARGGRLVMPLGPHGGDQRLMRIYRDLDGDLHQEQILAVRFVPLVVG